MSIVGPRPTIQAQVDQYTQLQRRRLEVKPGITGWAQINGRAALPWPERIELDVAYVEHRTLALALRSPAPLPATCASSPEPAGSSAGAAGSTRGRPAAGRRSQATRRREACTAKG